MKPGAANKFNEKGWRGYLAIRLSETTNLDREQEPVDLAFTAPAPGDFNPAAELRIVHAGDSGPEEIPAQFYRLERKPGEISGRVAFLAERIPAGGQAEFRLYHGNSHAAAPDYASPMRVSEGGNGPQHYFIENEFYKIETMPQSGQIWHVWNKKGSNKSWHHNEWNVNKDKGGDPCHWAPNCWAAYPERVTNGYDVMTGGEDIDLIDWNYAFGWQNPENEIISGPVFHEISRWGTIWPHPEHTNPGIRRDPSPFIRARVTYRFYAALPWFYQSSVLETLKDMRCFFIRNCQFVFLANIFSHTFIAPERKGILPEDEENAAVLRLMGQINRKPYSHQQHSLSNVLPSKLAYYGFYNEENSDGFALFQLVEKNSNTRLGAPVYQNHATLFSELPGWSSYYCRAFSYTNQRYNPENATFLPDGERYEEENICLIFKHADPADTLARMKKADMCLKNPLKAELL
ncbi:MAG: hypothetical protein WC299_01190 [Kiritimatiellia bacterium]